MHRDSYSSVKGVRFQSCRALKLEGWIATSRCFLVSWSPESGWNASASQSPPRCKRDSGDSVFLPLAAYTSIPNLCVTPGELLTLSELLLSFSSSPLPPLPFLSFLLVLFLAFSFSSSTFR